MRIDDAGPRTWLLAGLALWGLIVWLLATAGMGGRVEPLPEDPSLLQPLPQVRTTPPSRLGNLEQYSEVANRPLFAVDRRPQPFSLQGQGDPTETASTFDYVLTGVLLTPDFRMATLQPPDGSDTVRVHEGEAHESLRNWRLVELSARSAVFEGPNGRQTVALRVFDGIGGAPPTMIARQQPGSDDPNRPISSGAPPTNGSDAAPATVSSAASPVPPSADATLSREPPAPAGQTGPQPVNDQAQMEAIRQRIQERRRKLRADSPIQPPAQRP
ncbi:MAG: general secretion pathway protein GspN [Pseudomonadota bacterium]|nr:general secretion pathway protein GspN [Pseudomonadota bacterium]